jgi:hypothetical protein
MDTQRCRPRGLVRILAPVVLVALLPACGGDATSPDDELQGGVLATFNVEGEEFRVWVRNQETIRQLYDLRDGLSDASIPNGPLRAGSGRGGHNAPWSWHLDPDLTSMAELTIELCSGLPSFVEENLQEWLTSVGQYCPWSAQLIGLDDFTLSTP